MPALKSTAGETRRSAKAGATIQRYHEPPNLTVPADTGIISGLAPDDVSDNDVDVDANIEFTERTFGQRLSTLSTEDVPTGKRPSGSEPEHRSAMPSRRNKKSRVDGGLGVVPASSLTRTLIQALHSLDTTLLEACLRHSDESLIQNSVRRLPPTLAVPLLNTCIDWLGKDGGVHVGRASGLLQWVKAVLAVHMAYLISLPDVVARLSVLHTVFSGRLSLQEQLLCLNGRLELALKHREMWVSAVQIQSKVGQRKHDDHSPEEDRMEVLQYVEGQSADEDKEPEFETEDVDDDQGTIEEIELENGSTNDSDDDGEAGGLDGFNTKDIDDDSADDDHMR